MEEVEICETPNNDIKEIEINEEDKKYKCFLEPIKDYIHISIYDNNKIKYKGNIHIYNVLYNLGLYNFNIEDIFKEIYILNKKKFNIIKDKNKYQLKIEFKILNKKRNIYIDLNENEIINNDNEYVKKINELEEIIKMKDNRIKILEEELNKYKYNDHFNVELKEPKKILNYHKGSIFCSTALKDGRFVTGSEDKSIIIYNKESFNPDLVINEHKDSVKCVLELSSGELASCSNDNTINIYDIEGNKYKVIQTLKDHNDKINKIIELTNNKLVSCSWDKSIIFYNKVNNEYKKEYSFATNGRIGPIIQTKENEICYNELDKTKTLCFFDFNKKKVINKINVDISCNSTDCLLMISKDLLLVAGVNKISIVNVNSYNLIRTIDVLGSGYIFTSCILNKNIILTGDQNKRIIQWKIEEDNLKLISIKEDAHNDTIYTLSKAGNLILSGSLDKSVIIW